MLQDVGVDIHQVVNRLVEIGCFRIEGAEGHNSFLSLGLASVPGVVWVTADHHVFVICRVVKVEGWHC